MKVKPRSDGVKLVIVFAACIAAAGFAYSNAADSAARFEIAANGRDDAKARAAFIEASKVFFSPRCSNCHPAGDFPTQGDEMTQHSLDVMRGPDGKGVGDLKCTSCHQDANLDGDGLPPGVPNWHMPPVDNKMVFQGLTAGQLCRQLKDPAMNGGRKTAKEAVEHISLDPLVRWAWSPGNGRSTPPLSYEDFVKKMVEWVDNGADCPN